MAKRLKHIPRIILNRFWRMLESENVTPFQMMYYSIFCLAGIYGVFIAVEPPLTLKSSMSHVNIMLFYWLNIAGPAMGFGGKALERVRRFNYSGLWLQLGGNGMFCLALMAYMDATFEIESWGRGMYGAFPLATSSFVSTACLVIRDARRVLKIEARVRSEQ